MLLGYAGHGKAAMARRTSDFFCRTHLISGMKAPKKLA